MDRYQTLQNSCLCMNLRDTIHEIIIKIYKTFLKVLNFVTILLLKFHNLYVYLLVKSQTKDG